MSTKMSYTKGTFTINGTNAEAREAANDLAVMMTEADIVAEVRYDFDADTITVVQVGIWEMNADGTADIVYI